MTRSIQRILSAEAMVNLRRSTVQHRAVVLTIHASKFLRAVYFNDRRIHTHLSPGRNALLLIFGCI